MAVPPPCFAKVRRFFNARHGFKSLEVHGPGVGGSTGGAGAAAGSTAFDRINVRLADRSKLMALCKDNRSFHHDRCPLGVTLSSIQMQVCPSARSSPPLYTPLLSVAPLSSLALFGSSGPTCLAVSCGSPPSAAWLTRLPSHSRVLTSALLRAAEVAAGRHDAGGSSAPAHLAARRGQRGRGAGARAGEGGGEGHHARWGAFSGHNIRGARGGGAG